MFERFTDEARQVVVVSQEVARDLGDDAIRPEHLLLAVLTGGGVGQRVLEELGVEVEHARHVVAGLATDRADAAALGSIGIDLDEVRRRAEESFGPGALDRRGRPAGRRRGRLGGAGSIPFTEGAKAGLESALEEVLRRRSRSITDVHVLLGLIARDQAPAARPLRGLGVEPADVRLRLEESMAPS